MLTVLTVLALPAAPARAAIPVGYAAILVPVHSGALARAVVNPGPRHVEIKFRDGTEWEATYPPGAEPGLLRLLHARHVRVVFASAPPRARPRPARPRLRYLAGGAVIAAAIGAGAYAARSSRRRRRRPAAGG